MAQQPPPTEPEAKKPQSITARVITAAAFSTVGAKIGTFGMIPDASELLGKEMTMGQKFKGVFDGTLIRKMTERIQHLVVHEKKSVLSASASTMKWSLILTGIGMVGGAALGWARGGRIENWKDIITHPWRSTKLVLGLEQPKDETKKEEKKPEALSQHSAEEETATRTDFAARMAAQPTTHAEAALRPAAAGAHQL